MIYCRLTPSTSGTAWHGLSHPVPGRRPRKVLTVSCHLNFSHGAACIGLSLQLRELSPILKNPSDFSESWLFTVLSGPTGAASTLAGSSPTSFAEQIRYPLCGVRPALRQLRSGPNDLEIT